MKVTNKIKRILNKNLINDIDVKFTIVMTIIIVAFLMFANYLYKHEPPHPRLNLMRQPDDNEKPYHIVYYHIQDPISKQVYICKPKDVRIGRRIGEGIYFTDTSGVRGDLKSYLILNYREIQENE